jgi:Ca2+-binding EF-hand superfamily protein
MAQEHIKLEQGVWRRNHDALARRKVSQKLSQSGSESDLVSSSAKIKSCLKKGSTNTLGSDPDDSDDSDSDNDVEKSASTSMSITIAAPSFDAQGSIGGPDVLGAGQKSGHSAVQFDRDESGSRPADTSEKQDAAYDSPQLQADSAQGPMALSPSTTVQSSRRKSRVGTAKDISKALAPPQDQKEGDLRGSFSMRKSSEMSDHLDSTLPDVSSYARQGPVLAASSFDHNLLTLSQRHGLTIYEVKKRRDEFLSFSVKGDGILTQQEFEKAVRQRANIPENEAIPDHLTLCKYRADVAEAMSNKSEFVSFEEYLLWYINTAYAEEVMVTDPRERSIRSLARGSKLNIADVEHVKGVFDRFDIDGSQTICYNEFRPMLLALMKIVNPEHISPIRMNRYWSELKKNCAGSKTEVPFEQFLLWYFRFFDSMGKPRDFIMARV